MSFTQQKRILVDLRGKKVLTYVYVYIYVYVYVYVYVSIYLYIEGSMRERRFLKQC